MIPTTRTIGRLIETLNPTKSRRPAAVVAKRLPVISRHRKRSVIARSAVNLSRFPRAINIARIQTITPHLTRWARMTNPIRTPHCRSHAIRTSTTSAAQSPVLPRGATINSPRRNRTQRVRSPVVLPLTLIPRLHRTLSICRANNAFLGTGSRNRSKAIRIAHSLLIPRIRRRRINTTVFAPKNRTQVISSTGSRRYRLSKSRNRKGAEKDAHNKPKKKPERPHDRMIQAAPTTEIKPATKYGSVMPKPSEQDGHRRRPQELKQQASRGRCHQAPIARRRKRPSQWPRSLY